MAKRPKPRTDRVKEPVQLYLDGRDKTLLEELAERNGLSQAEVLRRGLRRLAAEMLEGEGPGSSVELLIGALTGVPGVPPDLSARHDDYLYARDEPGPSRGD